MVSIPNVFMFLEGFGKLSTILKSEFMSSEVEIDELFDPSLVSQFVKIFLFPDLRDWFSVIIYK